MIQAELANNSIVDRPVEEGEIVESKEHLPQVQKFSKTVPAFTKQESHISNKAVTNLINETRNGETSGSNKNRHHSRSRERERSYRQHSPDREYKRSRHGSDYDRSHRSKDSSYSPRDSRHRHSRNDTHSFRSGNNERKRSPEGRYEKKSFSHKGNEKSNQPIKSILKTASTIRNPNPDFDDIEIDFEDPEEKEKREIEERRKLRQAILEKHKHLQIEVSANSPAASTSDLYQSPIHSPIDISKNLDSSNNRPDLNVSIANSATPETDLYAADCNPDADRLAEVSRFQDLTGPGTFKKEVSTNLLPLNESNKKPILEDDDFDMFGDNSPIASETAPDGSLVVNVPLVVNKQNLGLQDNWDDEDGYYRVTIGEMLDDRFHVHATLGKGVFSSVVRAKDTQNDNQEVAIKIIRNNETMYRLAHKEIDILTKLGDADPNDKKHVIKIISKFEYRNHLCIVFESLSLNLREVVKKYGKDVGISIKAVRSYAHQLFIALHHLEKCGFIHADIKPDNILVSESHNVLKLCDLGSASSVSDNEITPYLVSRFYRAPEVRLPYNTAIDVWSVGCTLFEIFTGKLLLPGRDNNHMLKLMIDLKGRFPNKMIKRGGFADKHFDEDYGFLYRDKGAIKTIVVSKQPQKDLKSRILSVNSSNSDEELKMTYQLIDLLDRSLQINPEQRISVREALSHPFFN